MVQLTTAILTAWLDFTKCAGTHSFEMGSFKFIVFTYWALKRRTPEAFDLENAELANRVLLRSCPDLPASSGRRQRWGQSTPAL